MNHLLLMCFMNNVRNLGLLFSSFLARSSTYLVFRGILACYLILSLVLESILLIRSCQVIFMPFLYLNTRILLLSLLKLLY